MRAAATVDPDVPPAPRREFVGFYRTHFGFAWRTLLRLGVPASDCDDAAQEVFVTVHRRWASGAPNRRAWMFGIVRRIAWRYRRTRARHLRRVEAFGHVPPAAVDLDEELGRREAWSRRAGFLDELDDDKREAFVLGELEELGRTELGSVLGVNPNTAYSRLQAARRRFFAHFAQDDDDACANLLAHAVLESQPDDGASDRSFAAIAPLVAPVLASGPSLAAPAVAWIWGLALAGSAAIAVGTVSAAPTADVLVPGVVVEARVDATAPRSVIAPASAIAAAPVVEASPIQRPRTMRSRAEVPTPAIASVPAPDPAIEAELGVLLAARRALVDGDRSAARRHLAEHRARFGDGALAEVRDEIVRELDSGVIDPRAAGDSASRNPR
jgi:RNA polymerase sigma-70 factor (ECF subfamily)